MLPNVYRPNVTDLLDRVLEVHKPLATRSTLSYEELDDKFDIYLELPGWTKEELKVSVDGTALFIEGERKASKGAKAVKQTIQLPESADTEAVEAELKNGVLTVTVGKLGRAIKRTIEVK